ncbi:RNA-binding S4 domain-containing protein [Pseudomonadota bacterium]
MNLKNTQETRLDKWLWAARFFKTRQLAVKAVNGGHVEVNGNRAKPSRLTQIGDVIKVRKGPYTYILVVEGISDRRGPASVARTLYSETEASVSERRRLAVELKTRAAQILFDPGKPEPRSQRDARARKRAQH